MPYSVGYSVVNINDLKALLVTDLSDRYLLFVGSKNAWYRWSANSILPGDDESVIELSPAVATGRWLKTGVSSSFPSLTQISVTTSVLAPGAKENIDVNLGKQYEIISISTSVAAWVRVYGNLQYRTSDAARSSTEDAAENHGIYAEIKTTPSALTNDFMPVVGGISLEGVRQSLIPVAIANLTTTSLSITVSFVKVTKEN
ncbi:MAG: hypothetical protein ACRCZS_06710 [Chroococcidiopsis sp.]